MASAPAHALAAVALGTVLMPAGARRGRFLVTGALLAVLPDADVVGFVIGIRYEDMLGHRGLSHSILFAAATAALVVAVAGRWLGVAPAARARAWLALFVVCMSHAVLDAFTNGGLGVAFLAPFSSERFFFPVHPIAVSPISVTKFFSARGLAVLRSEAVYVGLPSLVLLAISLFLRRRR